MRISLTRISLTAVAIAGLLMVQGCTKSSSTSPSMTAIVNGTEFSTLGPGVVTDGAQKILTTITGVNSPETGSPIPTSISLVVYDSVNTYTVNTSNVTATFSSAATSGLPVTATAGTITVTKSTGSYFEGTFNLTFNSSSSSGGIYMVTNGQFTGTY